MKIDEYQAWARNLIENSDPEELLRFVENTVEENDEWRTKKCINLHAAESLLSPRAELLLQSDLGRRILLGEIGQRANKGTKYLDNLEALVTELAKKIFRVSFAEHRPVTTSVAEGIVLRSMTEIGDSILALEPPNGHPTWRQEGYAGYRGLNVIDVPFDYEKWNIDLAGLRRLVEKIEVRPKLLIVGTPAFLFPSPVTELAEIASECGAKVWYDGAHVLGLIAGERFQDPIGEGAYILTGTGSKTLSGPIGGLILHNDMELDKRIRSVLPGLLSTIGHNRTAALAATLIELSVFAPAYSQQIIANAKALARSLDEGGFDIIGRSLGYTESHTVLIDSSDLGGGNEVAELFERGNIISSAYPLRSTDPRWQGVRIGVTEVTRLGMKEDEMKEIGAFMKRLAIDKEPPERVTREVAEFRSRYTQVHYCL